MKTKKQIKDAIDVLNRTKALRDILRIIIDNLKKPHELEKGEAYWLYNSNLLIEEMDLVLKILEREDGHENKKKKKRK